MKKNYPQKAPRIPFLALGVKKPLKVGFSREIATSGHSFGKTRRKGAEVRSQSTVVRTAE